MSWNRSKTPWTMSNSASCNKKKKKIACLDRKKNSRQRWGWCSIMPNRWKRVKLKLKRFRNKMMFSSKLLTRASSRSKMPSALKLFWSSRRGVLKGARLFKSKSWHRNASLSKRCSSKSMTTVCGRRWKSNIAQSKTKCVKPCKSRSWSIQSSGS